MSQRINPNVERSYEIGERVFFYDDKQKGWKQGTALVKLGKTLYLKYGNFLRRVAIDKVRPDHGSEEKKQEEFLEPDDDEARFKEEESPIQEMAAELELSEKVNKLKTENDALRDELRELKFVSDDKIVSNPNEEVDTGITIDREKDPDPDCGDMLEEEDSNPRKEQVKRKEKKKVKKNKEAINQYPKVGQEILFQKKNSENKIAARVVRTFKKTSKHKNFRHLLLENGDVIEVDFQNQVEAWEEIPDKAFETDCEEVFYLSSILGNQEQLDDAYPVKLVPRSEYGKEEVVNAMKAEIKKYEDFDAFEEVDDKGQYSVPVRWVVTEQKENGKGVPVKARMCIRGDQEIGKENIRADSPTAAKESLSLALIIAANEGFEVKAGDIKSAYLQGAKLTRDIFVRPPSQVDGNGKLWKLKQAAYGILDGGRLFYLKFVEKMEELGLHKIHSDGAMFTYVKEGKLQGLIVVNVDDVIMAGNDKFKVEVEEKLKDMFRFSKIEEKEFVYCGCRIRCKDDGTIELDQDQYLDTLAPMNKVPGADDRELDEEEKKEARGKVGALLWVSLLTRPDLSFDVNILSSEVSKGTVKTIKNINKTIRKAKDRRNRIRFVKLGPISKLIVKVYSDASFGNQDQSTRSTAGRLIFIENKDTRVMNVAAWKTKKIARVCRSVKGAETRALEEALDVGVHTARLIEEIYKGAIEIKNPSQIPVEALTDSKSVWENLHNTRQ